MSLRLGLQEDGVQEGKGDSSVLTGVEQNGICILRLQSIGEC